MAPTLTRRQTLAAALAVAALPRLAWAQGARAVPDMTIGDANAPVTIVEYAMFTCPHCAVFNQEVLPKIKANYIDTGKVKLCLLYTSPSPRDLSTSRMPSSA